MVVFLSGKIKTIFQTSLLQKKRLYLPFIFPTARPGSPGFAEIAKPLAPLIISPVMGSTLIKFARISPGTILDTKPQVPGVLSVLKKPTFPSVKP